MVGPLFCNPIITSLKYSRITLIIIVTVYSILQKKNETNVVLTADYYVLHS